MHTIPGKNNMISFSDSNGFTLTHLPCFMRGVARSVMTLPRGQNALMGTWGSGKDRQGTSCKQALSLIHISEPTRPSP